MYMYTALISIHRFASFVILSDGATGCVIVTQAAVAERTESPQRGASTTQMTVTLQRLEAENAELRRKQAWLEMSVGTNDSRKECAECAELKRMQAWLEGTIAEARQEKEAAGAAGASQPERRQAEGARGDHFELKTKDELLDVIWEDRQELAHLRDLLKEKSMFSGPAHPLSSAQPTRLNQLMEEACHTCTHVRTHTWHGAHTWHGSCIVIWLSTTTCSLH